MELSVKHTTAYKAIVVFAVLGVLISAFSTYLHFQNTPSSFCNLGEGFNCDIVNKGVYSEIFGIPVAALGILGYAVIAAFAYEMLARPRRRVKLMLAAYIAAGVAFSAHLAWVSSYLLNTWCVVCIASYICIAGILAAFIYAEW